MGSTTSFWLAGSNALLGELHSAPIGHDLVGGADVDSSDVVSIDAAMLAVSDSALEVAVDAWVSISDGVLVVVSFDAGALGLKKPFRLLCPFSG